MEIVSMRDYQGRNIYSHKPVIRMTVDLGYLSNRFTKEFRVSMKTPGILSGLNKHYCSPGYPGGFVERLQEGTRVSHVTEHLAIELQCLMGYDVYFGKTRVFQEPDLYHIIYEYINQACAMNFGYAAAKIVLALVSGESDSIEAILRQLQRRSLDSDLGPSTRAIWNEARRRQIPSDVWGGQSVTASYGKYMRFIEASLPDSTSSIAVGFGQK